MRGLFFCGLIGAVGLFGMSTPAEERASHKLESALDQLRAAYQLGGLSSAAKFAGQSAIELVASKVRVVVKAETPQQVEAISRVIESLEGSVETTYQHLIQVLIPISALGPLAELKEVRFIELPVYAIPAVMSEGVGVIGADAWQQAGITGKNIKVAVIDVGFTGYKNLLGRELPAEVITRSFRADGRLETHAHGTAVAEIVFDVAPGAQLFLINISTSVEFLRAIDWLIAQKVDIMTMSLVWFTGCYLGDGGAFGPVTQKVRESGILWIASAGNEARSHWSGAFFDDDGNGQHNFTPTDETQSIALRNGEGITIELSWDDPCEASSNDYNLFLLDGSNNVVTRSTGVQNGNGPPRERLSFTAPSSASYHILIKKERAVRDARLKLFNLSRHRMEYPDAAGSIPEIGISKYIFTVGATFWRNDTLEPFSSQGPTPDGRLKPDITAPDGVANFTFSRGFFGTSASAPHVAGAAALVKQVFRRFTPDQIQEFLEERAEDLGEPGKDNLFGAGRLNLGAALPLGCSSRFSLSRQRLCLLEVE